jgi:hypothetical protein
MFETPTASDAIFEVVEDDDWVLRIHVSGEGYVARALPLVAYVGDVQVRQIQTFPGADGFTGALDAVPPDGAVLRLGWADDAELVDTPIVFHTGPNV